jgi:hypothetical protein
MVALARLVGRRGPSTDEIVTDQNAVGEQSLVQTQVAAQRVAGPGSRTAPIGVPTAGAGWNLTLSYNETKSRPIRGGNVVEFDPTTQCGGIIDALTRFQCEQNALNGGGSGLGNTAGDTLFQGRQRVVYPPSRMIQAQTSFNVTPKWAAQWGTSYDLVRKEFGLHQVSLQRELHDWRAIFAFTQSPTGAFAFNFFISLIAQPDIKFDYNRRSYPRRGSAAGSF